MRAGGCTVQQALTPEAANIVKQAVGLARRRGHAQVTPLHVASTMLSSSTGLLRTACLQSHSHPLQCKALELCFNVALNRLPASSSNPMLGHHGQQYPSLSNALVAAFKRAQAHQRRGSIENQQQPLLAVRVEVEQLVISILDDPSVSRVMREAGFSSTQVKSNVEKTVSTEVTASSPSSANKPSKQGNALINMSSNAATCPVICPSPSPHFGVPNMDDKATTKVLVQARSEDVMQVLQAMVNKRRRNTVVVGDCLASVEGLMRRAMEKVNKEEVGEELKNLQFISLPLFSFSHFSKEEVDQKLGEVRCIVKSCVNGRGAVLYVGDLEWIAEFQVSSTQQGRNYYCPVEHMVIELGRLVCSPESELGKLWLMGVATHQTYSKCKIGAPSLEIIWGLHPLIIAANNLSLNISADSDQLISSNKRVEDCSFLLDGVEKELTCCSNCSDNFQREVQTIAKNSVSNHDSTITTSSSLPSWLRQYKEEHKKTRGNDQDFFQVRELWKKWNSFCSSFHKDHHHPLRKILSFSSSTNYPPSSSFSFTSFDKHFSENYDQPIHQTWPMMFTPSNSNFWPVSTSPEDHSMPNPNASSRSASSDTMEMDHLPKFKEINAENLKNLCNALEQKVPWQKEIIPEISSTVLQCRSGMVRRRGGKTKPQEAKEETWLFFQGSDTDGKEKIARELANLVFGSPTNFVSIGLSSFSSTRSDLTDDYRNKRSRDEPNSSYLERFANALSANPQRVFFLEDIEQVDYFAHLGIKDAIERGCITTSNGKGVSLRDAIIILSCETFDSRSRASSPIRQKSECDQGEEGVQNDEDGSSCSSPSICSLDLNLTFEDSDEPSFDDIGLLEAVDRRFILKLQEYL